MNNPPVICVSYSGISIGERSRAARWAQNVLREAGYEIGWRSIEADLTICFSSTSLKGQLYCHIAQPPDEDYETLTAPLYRQSLRLVFTDGDLPEDEANRKTTLLMHVRMALYP